MGRRFLVSITALLVSIAILRMGLSVDGVAPLMGCIIPHTPEWFSS